MMQSNFCLRNSRARLAREENSPLSFYNNRSNFLKFFFRSFVKINQPELFAKTKFLTERLVWKFLRDFSVIPPEIIIKMNAFAR